MFIWGTLTVNLLGNHRQIWYPYVLTWILGSFLEACIFLVNDCSGVGQFYSNLDPSLQTSRIICMVSLVGFGLFFSANCKISRCRTDEENRPLLASDGGLYESYSSFPSNDGPDDFSVDDEHGQDGTKELKEKQRRRLEECGSWMAYLKDFKLLAKLAWPSGDRSAQACLAVLIVIILADRALNLLVPRQLGIITDALASMHETGERF